MNGSGWPGSGDRYGDLDGVAPREDPDPADGRDAGRGRHRGGRASSFPRVRLWSYQSDQAGDRWRPGNGSQRSGGLPPDPRVLDDTPPAPWGTQPPAGRDDYHDDYRDDYEDYKDDYNDDYQDHYRDDYRQVNHRAPAPTMSYPPAVYDDRSPAPLPPTRYPPVSRYQAHVPAVPHGSAVSPADEHPTQVVPYPQPREGTQLAPLGTHPVLVAQGTGPKLGVRAAVVSLAAIVVLAVIGYGVYAVAQTPPLTNLSAQVVSTGQVVLGFPQAGILSKVLIRPGEHVAAGQMLATEVVAGLNQQVAADRQAVHTDQGDISLLTTLVNQVKQQATSNATSQQQTAASGVSSAADAINSTQSARQAAISAFETEVNTANQTLQADESTYAKTCGSSPAGGSDCRSLAHLVAADNQSLASAKANLSAQQAAQADWEAEANRLLADQKAAQTGLNGDTTMALAPLDVDLANARSQLSKDQAQLTTDRAKEAEEKLQAPQAATVVSVDGAPGEVVSGTGVSGGNATGGSVSVKPGFELFPSQQSSAGSQASSPVAVLEVGGPLVVNVVVPESQIGLVHMGAPATITPGVAGPRSASGAVTEIFPTSIVAAGVVSYEVQVKASSGAAKSGWMQGMTATATISR